jgi:hypothetical protein
MDYLRTYKDIGSEMESVDCHRDEEKDSAGDLDLHLLDTGGAATIPTEAEVLTVSEEPTLFPSLTNWIIRQIYEHQVKRILAVRLSLSPIASMERRRNTEDSGDNSACSSSRTEQASWTTNP